MFDPALGPHPIERVVCHSLLMIAGLAIAFTLGSGDRRAAARDLRQDYTSARAWLDGDSAYRPLSELFDRYGFPPAAPDVMVLYNPHPPAAILLTVPFALTRFETAAQLVVWTQLVALAFTWVLCYELFRPRIPEWAWA